MKLVPGRSRSRSMGKLNNGVSHIPPSPLALNTEIVAERKNLPIFVHKKSIVSAIQNHQVYLKLKIKIQAHYLLLHSHT